MPLSRKQQDVFNFIKGYLEEHGISPSFEEIRRHFKFRSLSTVAGYIAQLREKRFITTGASNKKRSIELPGGRVFARSIPLLGQVAAGTPIDPLEDFESVELPESMLGPGETVALRVKGDSMQESGILSRDVIVVRRQETAEDGEIVIALLDGQATLKELRRRRGRIELVPHNGGMQKIVVSPGQDFRVYGVLVGLYRSF